MSSKVCLGIAFTVAACALPVGAESPSTVASNPVSIGTVAWSRDFDRSLADSARTGKPVFAFFQEVPGCAGCQKFGAEVMSYGPIVEAVQREFVPLLVYNNRGGEDAEILERYGEPAWNYQVVRFLDGTGADLVPRKDRVWTRDALASRMIEALAAAGRLVPHYLEVVAYEDDAERLATVAFAQACFWSGEVALGQVPGVITTEAGWIDGREVTLVRYRPDLVTLEELVDRAAAAGAADEVYVPSREERRRLRERDGGPAVASLGDAYRRAPEVDQKRQIRGSIFDHLGLTPMQRTKVNAFVTVDMAQAMSWLTPGQAEELERKRAAERGDP